MHAASKWGGLVVRDGFIRCVNGFVAKQNLDSAIFMCVANSDLKLVMTRQSPVLSLNFACFERVIRISALDLISRFLHLKMSFDL